MQVRAKFKVTDKNQNVGGFEIKMSPVTSGSPENEKFFKYTPGGTVHIMTINADAAKQFEVGQEYYVDFTHAESDN